MGGEIRSVEPGDLAHNLLWREPASVDHDVMTRDRLRIDPAQGADDIIAAEDERMPRDGDLPDYRLLRHEFSAPVSLICLRQGSIFSHVGSGEQENRPCRAGSPSTAHSGRARSGLALAEALLIVECGHRISPPAAASAGRGNTGAALLAFAPPMSRACRYLRG